jgi:hypothetical protein
MRRMPERRLNRMSLFLMHHILIPTFILPLKGRVGGEEYLKK